MSGRRTRFAGIPRHEHSIPWFWPFAGAVELGEAGLALFAENLKFVAEVAKLEYALEPTWATANRILRELDDVRGHPGRTGEVHERAQVRF